MKYSTTFSRVVIPSVIAWILVSYYKDDSQGSCLSAEDVLDGAKMVSLDNGNLEYFTFGADPRAEGVTRVLLQHGTGREGKVFAFFDKFFKANKLAVIAPTLPGHGCSSRQPDRKLIDWGTSVAKVLERESWINNGTVQDSGFFVAGYSFGSPHALAIFASPELEPYLRGVFMVSSTLPSELRETLSTDLPEEIIPFKNVLLNKNTGPKVMSLLLSVAKRKVLGKLYRAMDGMRSNGYSALADWLEESTDRSFSKASAGLVDNLRIREDPWGGLLDRARKALRRKPKDFPLLLVSEQTDPIDPSAVSAAIAQYLNAESEGLDGAKAVHNIWPEKSPHGHWHYWPRFEVQLRNFLISSGVQLPAQFDSEQTESCQPSPLREYGPFYKLGQPYKNSICEMDELVDKLGWAVAESTFTRQYHHGPQPLKVTGVVTEWDGSKCVPVENAEIDIWQSHQYGPYGSLDPGVKDGFCRGVVTTDQFGRFSFTTFMPSSYGAIAGHGPFGPGIDIPPFVDRHIHLAVWAPGRELLVTQILHLDDPLLKSGVRSAHHGYEGTGVLVQPNQTGDTWSFEDVSLVMPRTSRRSRIHDSREKAAIEYCSYSTGDFLVPGVCMPGVTKFISPMNVYFLLMPAVIYIWVPCIVLSLYMVLRRIFANPEKLKNNRFKSKME